MGKETKAGNQEARWETKMGNQGRAIKMGNQGGKPRPAFRVGEGLRIVEAVLWSRGVRGSVPRHHSRAFTASAQDLRASLPRP